jgi:hypothetical protein
MAEDLIAKAELQECQVTARGRIQYTVPDDMFKSILVLAICLS